MYTNSFGPLDEVLFYSTLISQALKGIYYFLRVFLLLLSFSVSNITEGKVLLDDALMDLQVTRLMIHSFIYLSQIYELGTSSHCEYSKIEM